MKIIACAGIILCLSGNVYAGTDAEVQGAIDAAKAASQKADAVQGAWLNTGKLIKKAEAAAAGGNKSLALKLAKKARKEAELARAQAIYEYKHWTPPPYLQKKLPGESTPAETKAATTGMDVQSVIESAKAANRKAGSVQGIWLSTGKLIKKAKAAAARGDETTALKLAEKAKREAELAYAQAAYERKNWTPPPYLR
ncbi:MAG: hypothetical protein GY862_36300 [Gammaproteobacteria bacterium]|nr:hypothetical protein [Gammaproteobacteria bacterium]